MTAVHFEVLGTPTPQGSKTKMPNGAMVEGGSANQRAMRRDWRSAVAQAARDVAADVGQLDGPLHLTVHFRFPMPKSRPAVVRGRGIAWKTSAPDLDKLVRSVGDGLVAGGLILDDARLVEITAMKSEVMGWTGAQLHIETIEEPRN